jgi:hypothetical protein
MICISISMTPATSTPATTRGRQAAEVVLTDLRGPRLAEIEKILSFQSGRMATVRRRCRNTLVKLGLRFFTFWHMRTLAHTEIHELRTDRTPHFKIVITAKRERSSKLSKARNLLGTRGDVCQRVLGSELGNLLLFGSSLCVPG